MKTFLWTIRVYYEDTDCGGVVYHSRYINFLERARTEWLRSLGFEQDQLRQELGILFAVRSVNIDYLQPARFNNELEVFVGINSIAKASMVLSQEIRIKQQSKPLVEASVRIVCLDAVAFKPKVIPDVLLKEIVSD